jgi:Uma2 family endonuclease
VPGSHADYLTAHPQRLALLVEVADASLRFDRREKESVYARGGVQDYWIVNLTNRALEVYRDPHADPSAVWGWSYRSVRTVRLTEVVTPLALPSTPVSVAALLPRARA